MFSSLTLLVEDNDVTTSEVDCVRGTQAGHCAFLSVFFVRVVMMMLILWKANGALTSATDDNYARSHRMLVEFDGYVRGVYSE